MHSSTPFEIRESHKRARELEARSLHRMGSRLTKTLEKQAEEIAREGHNAWGNTMTEAARVINGLLKLADKSATDKISDEPE